MIRESLARSIDVDATYNPFPGLRPFEFYENHLFFGRDGQSEQLIEKLSRSRFLSVVGTSGSGKSSLVRAGLLPSLLGGMLISAGSSWRVALLRPGTDLIGNLAQALCSPDAFGSEEDDDNRELQVAITEATLRRGKLGLIEAVRQAGMPPAENLLVIADQFEELFRIQLGEKAEALENHKAAFVKLLLAAASQRDLPIYVVLTMRSDYLGNCSQFQNLPEAINEGQYLIPRLTRTQLRETITGPIALAGGEITPRLLSRLLSDIGDKQDQLPVLQHALMRVWDEYQEKRLKIEGRPHREIHAGDAIDLCCYEAVGRLTDALSRHADEAFDELPDERHQQLTARLFKCLSEKGDDNRETRRPVSLGEICQVAEATVAEIKLVIETFRRSGRSFLMPPAVMPLTADSLIDISHESLLRVWRRLTRWVSEEASSARIYKRLAETAALYRDGKASLYSGPDLQTALNWRAENRPNQAWARRYHSNFENAERFLAESKQAADEARQASALRQKRQIKKLLFWTGVFATLSLIAFGMYLYALRQEQAAAASERLSQKRWYIAQMNLAQKVFEQEGDFAGSQELLANFLPDQASAQVSGLRDFYWGHLWLMNHNEKKTLKGNSVSVRAVAFSPDGRILASAGFDHPAPNSIRLWEVGGEKGPVILGGHAEIINSISFSPDGRMLASGSNDDTVKLWEVESRKELATLKGHVKDVCSVAFSPDGQLLASGSSDTSIKLWEVKSGKERMILSGHREVVRSIAFSPDGRILASGSSDNTIRLWDVKSGRELAEFKGHKDVVNALSFSPDGRMLASGSDDDTVGLWEIESREKLAFLSGHRNHVNSVFFFPDGRMLVSGSEDGALNLWDVESRRLEKTLNGHIGSVHSVAISRDGRVLASGSEDKTVKLWEVGSNYERTTHNEHGQRPVRSVAFSPDGRTLASGSEDKTAKLWDVKSGLELAMLDHSSVVNSVAFSPTGLLLATGSADSMVRLWDVERRKELVVLNGHRAPVNTVAFSPDGLGLASGSDDATVRLWELSNRREPVILREHKQSVNSIAFSPDGRTLASGGDDNIIILWDVKSGRVRATFDNRNEVNSIAFSPDGLILESGGADGSLKRWDVIAGHEILPAVKGKAKPIYALVFFPGEKMLASGGQDGSLTLWNAELREEVARLTLRNPASSVKKQEGAVRSVAASPDGRMLASGHFGGQISFWFAATADQVEKQRGK